MKTQASVRLFCVAFTSAAAGFAADAPALQASFIDPDAPEIAEIRQLGENAIGRIGTTMVTEATTAVTKSGPVLALDACHLKTVVTTNGTVAGMPRITAMKRTSVKLRDPKNAPDAAEQLALHRMEVAINAGRPPNVLVQKIENPGGATEWRVYRPLVVRPNCLPCHGPSGQMSAELRTALKTRYPDDQAVDFAVGEWRGLLRVTVADRRAAAEVRAEEILNVKFPHFLLFFLALMATGLAAEVKKIAPAEAAKRVAAGTAVLVDVREPKEWAETGVAAPAQLLPKSDFDGPQKQWKDFLAHVGAKEVILYCRTGHRAGIIAAKLAEQGMKVANAGGLKDWTDAGLPVRKIAGQVKISD